MLANWLRMRGYEWKLGLIFVTLAIALFIVVRAFDFKERKFRMPMGVDLKGGVILIYEVHWSAAAARSGHQAQCRRADDQCRHQHGGSDAGPHQPHQSQRHEGNRHSPVRRPAGGDHHSGSRRGGSRRTSSGRSARPASGVPHRRQRPRPPGHHRAGRGAVAGSRSCDAGSASTLCAVVVDGVAKTSRWASGPRPPKRNSRRWNWKATSCATRRPARWLTSASLGPIRDKSRLLEDYLADNGLRERRCPGGHERRLQRHGRLPGDGGRQHGRILEPLREFPPAGGRGRQIPVADQLQPARHGFDAAVLSALGDCPGRTRLISFPRLITTISDSGRITGNFTQDEVSFLVGILRAASCRPR